MATGFNMDRFPAEQDNGRLCPDVQMNAPEPQEPANHVEVPCPPPAPSPTAAISPVRQQQPLPRPTMPHLRQARPLVRTRQMAGLHADVDLARPAANMAPLANAPKRLKTNSGGTAKREKPSVCRKNLCAMFDSMAARADRRNGPIGNNVEIEVEEAMNWLYNLPL